MSIGARLRRWHPRTPPLPQDLADLVRAGDPEWFARELAIAVAPPWWVWTHLLRRFSWVVGIFGRVEVTGSIPEELRRGPLLLAANHIGDFDPFVIAVALHRLGVAPRIMTTGGIISAPVAGALLERTGAIRVERGTELARHAVRVTEVALVHGGHVVAYPEGRVGLAPDFWPERGRTGMARLALGLRVPVIPVSQWGAHEVLQYGNDWGKLRTLLRAVVRRPALRVHVGPPVVFDDLQMGRVGDANRARMRIAAALTRGLRPLRADELDAPAFRDPTRPTTAVAAFPGGIVPDDIP
ncbi:lysophospholipid acyltransferase family protein [Blastococcus saxobsidens]|uniref:Phospholipid/glycerol acyltransferase (Modular protein) n=1 Tax=Blastococcus saxobsidens (strain DD2) TaxID=1146883 RepID=H6RIX8_BLASD|nr:lysophospholipid acyltransferase family protein [Blastococcus saxobsidens]CCG03520.1 Phospholipid/glycerol acyltransferase (modular protein) [Blastococcus saxobsidens DD2]